MKKLHTFQGAMPFFVALFFNAFVDLGHKIVVQNTVFKTYSDNSQVLWAALLNSLILLPYIFLFSPAGFVSDRFAKNRVMQCFAWMALTLTGLITLFYHLGWFWPAFAMTLLFGVQSAFYGPAKLGYIKRLFGKENLAPANGAAQAVAIIAILAGGLMFSFAFEAWYPGEGSTQQEIIRSIAPAGWLLMLSSLIELLMVYRLPTLEENQQGMRFNLKEYFTLSMFTTNMRPILSREVIRLSIVGLAMFWSIGQVLLAAFGAFAKESMGETNTIVVNGMLAFFVIGVASGSYLAGRASKHHIETGLIPVGAAGLALGLWLLPTLSTVPAHALNFMFLGTMGGLFIVPLNALIQFHAGEKEMGVVLAGMNWIQNVAMLVFLILTMAASLAQFSARSVLIFCAVVAVLGGAYTVFKLPQSLLRFLLAKVISSRYKILIQGVRNIPAKGGVLLLGNHISWIDWAIVQIACPRTMHFVMLASIYEKWYLKWFLKAVGCIPIAQGASSQQSLEQVAELLKHGKVVCLFPEGAISRTGHLGSFRHGYERACELVKDDVVILPFYLRGLWGSQFSRSSEWLKKTRSKGLKRDLIVAFGQPLPKDTSADVLKRRIFDLSIDSWSQYVSELPTLGDAWIETVKSTRQNFAVAEAHGDPLSAKRLFVAALCFARRIRERKSENNIGVLLPTSSAGAIANMAILLSGKVIVNLNYSASIGAMQSAITQANIRTIYTSRQFLTKLKARGIDFDSCFANSNLVYMEDVKQSIGKSEAVSYGIAVTLLPTFILKRLFSHSHNGDDTAAILFSSGSEGTPKGIMLSHRNIMANLKQISDVLNTEQSDVVMASLPLFHAFGLTVTQFMPLIEGLPMICHPDPTDALGIAKCVARYRATLLCGTSTFLRLFVRNKKVHPLMLSSLRLVVAGAEKLRSDVREQFKLKFHHDILEGYGATETTPVASVNLPDALDMNYWNVQKGGKLGTVGMPLPGTSFKIVDPNTWRELPTNEEGMILIGGAQVMQGYLNSPEKTEAAVTILDGTRWYITGDKGRLDEDGFLTIVDRYSRFAKLGGEMVSLSQVEEWVRNYLPSDADGEDDSAEVIAVNVPDEKKGEKVIVLTDVIIDGNNIKQAMLAGGCSNLMIPEAWYTVEKLPKLGSGKTDFSLAKQMALQLSEAELS